MRRTVTVALGLLLGLSMSLGSSASANEAALSYRTSDATSWIAFNEGGTWYSFVITQRDRPNDAYDQSAVSAYASFGTTRCSGGNYGHNAAYPLEVAFHANRVTVVGDIPMSCYDWTADPSSTSPVVSVELVVDARGHRVVSVDTVSEYDEMIEARYTRTTKSSLTYATGAYLSWDLPDAPMVPQPFLGDEAFITMRETHSVYPQGEA